MTFANLPPVERWNALDAYLKNLTLQKRDIDPTAEFDLEELAKKHDSGVISLRNRLISLGCPCYRLGKKWHCRAVSYAAALHQAENLSEEI